MKGILTEVFSSTSTAIKKISKIVFVLCAIIGGLTLLVGLIRLCIASYEWEESIFEMLSYTAIDALGRSEALDGYNAKAQILQGLYIVLAGLAVIPMYGFGCTMEDVAEIRKAVSGKEE